MKLSQFVDDMKLYIENLETPPKKLLEDKGQKSQSVSPSGGISSYYSQSPRLIDGGIKITGHNRTDKFPTDAGSAIYKLTASKNNPIMLFQPPQS